MKVESEVVLVKIGPRYVAAHIRATWGGFPTVEITADDPRFKTPDEAVKRARQIQDFHGRGQ